MKKRLPLIVLAAAGAALAAVILVSRLLEASRTSQLRGSLESTTPTTEIDLTEADMTLRWDAANRQLSLTRTSSPEKTIWQTVPGQPFISAALAQSTVTEVRGNFTVEDRRTATCTLASLDDIRQTGEDVTLSGELSCGQPIGPTSYSLTFTPAAAGHLTFTATVDHTAINRLYLTFASTPNESLYGFGEQFSFVDLNGKRLPILVQDQGVGRGAEPITTGANLQAGAGGHWYSSYAPAPQFISSAMYGFWLETYAYNVFDMRRTDRIQVEVWANDVSGSIIDGDTPAELITLYTASEGRMQPLPAWVTSGAIIGMQGGTERVREVYGQLQEAGTPIAAFWLQDWVGRRVTEFGSQLWWNWEVDGDQYPGWDELVADLESDGIRMMTYASPFLVDASEKGNAQRNLYAEAAERGYLVKNEQGEPYPLVVTFFDTYLVDFTNPDAAEWYKQVLIEQVIGAGASGWMADFGEALPFDAQLHAGDAAEVHNQYPELWAQVNQQAIAEAGLQGEAVYFMRAGYRESPAHATLFWLGDQLVSWDRHDGIKTAVMGLLSSGFSGYAYNHSDIGGYTTITNPIRDYHRSEELLLRWMELNAFSTIYRTHEGNLPDANAQFYDNAATLRHFTEQAQVYTAWGFYRDELVAEAAETGLPVVRHPFIHYPADVNLRSVRWEQFMVGTELMVAPVVNPNTTEVTLYLPAGEWVHLWTGDTYSGGESVTVAAPLGQPGVFYPAGSAVGEQFAQNLRELGLLE